MPRSKSRPSPVQHDEPVANPEARPYSLFAVDRCKGAAGDRRDAVHPTPTAHVLLDGPYYGYRPVEESR